MTVTGRFLLFSHLLYVRKKSNSAAKLRFFLRNAKKIRNFSAFSLPFAKKTYLCGKNIFAAILSRKKAANEKQ